MDCHGLRPRNDATFATSRRSNCLTVGRSNYVTARSVSDVAVYVCLTQPR